MAVSFIRPIVPFSVADANAVPQQDPGLPSGSSASASAAAAALPGEDSEYEEAINEPTITGEWIKRAGQTKWRICGVHMHHAHANLRRNHGRESAADVVGIALRENVMQSQATGIKPEAILKNV